MGHMFDLVTLIKTAGYLGVGIIVFTESGLLIGVILPGDSLLFTAGFLASQGYLNIILLALVAFIAAVLGDNVGYWLGKRFGHSVFSRRGSLLLDPSHIEKAEKFYAAHGPKTIMLARFVPVMRTLAPVLAGVGSMHWRTFAIYNVLGGLLWGVGLSVGGYALGAVIPDADRYILPIVALIIIASLLPGLWHFFREPEHRRASLAKLRSIFSR
jgi:membrane-associated protein